MKIDALRKRLERLKKHLLPEVHEVEFICRWGDEDAHEEDTGLPVFLTQWGSTILEEGTDED